MVATEEQEVALQSLLRRYNVFVDAPPGTGKSWLLVEAGKLFYEKTQENVLIVAYNTELAAELVQTITNYKLDEYISCFTFHGLCTNFFELASDDVSLDNCIQKMEKNEKIPSKFIDVGALLIDESQDMNNLHLRLLKCLVKKPPLMMIVGDPRQRLYDFGQYPSLMVQSDHFSFINSEPWMHVSLTLSQRITPSIAKLVDCYFNSGLRSIKNEDTRVHAHKVGKWNIGERVEYILKQHDVPFEDVNLLAATKTGNTPLKTAINYLSSKNIPLYVQGVDGSNIHVRKKKIRVMSFHASKGTECTLSIVLVPYDVSDNPLYVALTRSKKYLHVLFVAEEVHAGLLNSMKLSGVVLHDGLEYEKGIPPPIQRVKEKRKIAQVSTPRNTFIARRAKISNISSASNSIGDSDMIITNLKTGMSEDVSKIYTVATMAKLEYEHTGRIRAMEDIITPVRLDYTMQETAIRAGHMGRFVSPKIREESLLNKKCLEIASHSYDSVVTVQDWCSIAAAILSWNGYHHSMQQVLPVSDWVDEQLFEKIYGVAKQFTILDDNTRFDIRMKKDSNDTLVHTRAHIVTKNMVYHIIWGPEITNTNHAEAMVRAWISGAQKCTIISLSSGAVSIVKVENNDDINADMLLEDN